MDLDDIMTMPREKLRTFNRSAQFAVDPLTMGEDARISIYTRPISTHRYVAGMDAALGVEDRDYDALTISDASVRPVEQVAELEGRWGTDRFDRLVYCMLRYYFNAFLVGERQFGLPTLRSLINNFHYGYLYYQRDEESKGRRRQDVLGIHRTAGDLTIPLFQRAVYDKQYIVRSERQHHQIELYQFRPKGRRTEKTSEMRDADLTTGAPHGEHDDLALAGAYSWVAVNEMPNFEDQRPPFEEGKAADVLGMAEVLIEKPRAPQRTGAFANRVTPTKKPTWYRGK